MPKLIKGELAVEMRRSVRAHRPLPPHSSPCPRVLRLLCRFRPLNSIETRENSKIIVDFDENKKTLNLTGDAVALAGSEKVSPPPADSLAQASSWAITPHRTACHRYSGTRTAAWSRAAPEGAGKLSLERASSWSSRRSTS